MSQALAENDRELSGFNQLLAIEDTDALARRAVELARDIIGLVRVSIYLREQARHFLVGTWGSNAAGRILDEHHVLYATTNIDAMFPPGEEGAPYSVFDDCLVVEDRLSRTDVTTRGWVACTPVRHGHAVIGVMVNDAGPLHAVFDEAKQAQGAILCSLLGIAIGSLAGTDNARPVAADRLPTHRVVMAAVAMLLHDPGVERDQIARELGVDKMRLERMFRAHRGIAISDYRNQLRLDRVAFLIAKGRTSLAEAVIAAGFESHDEFQQISRAFRRTPPSRRLVK